MAIRRNPPQNLSLPSPSGGSRPQKQNLSPPPPPRLEIEEVDFTKNIDSYMQQITSQGKVRRLERTSIPKFSNNIKNFYTDRPRIIFVSEYIVKGEYLGCLICWERYPKDAEPTPTTYDVFKKNNFKSEEAGFKRIFTLPTKELKEETKKYMEYLRVALGVSLPLDDIFIFFDHKTKKDRVYEYSVRATFRPVKAEDVLYEAILHSQGYLRYQNVNEKARLPVISKNRLGSDDYGWIISLLDEKLPFFGSGPGDTNVNEWLNELTEADVGFRNNEAFKELLELRNTYYPGYNKSGHITEYYKNLK